MGVFSLIDVSHILNWSFSMWKHIIEITAKLINVTVRKGYFFNEFDYVRPVNTFDIESFLLVVEACESVSWCILSKLFSYWTFPASKFAIIFSFLKLSLLTTILSKGSMLKALNLLINMGEQ